MTPDQLLQCVDETSLLNKQQRLTAKTYIDNYGRKIEGKKTVDDEEKYDSTIQTNKIPSVVTVSTAAVEEQMLRRISYFSMRLLMTVVIDHPIGLLMGIRRLTSTLSMMSNMTEDTRLVLLQVDISLRHL